MSNEFFSQAAYEATKDNDGFIKQYVQCIYFTDTGDDEWQIEAESEFSEEALAKCVEDCEDFQKAHEDLLLEAYSHSWYSVERAGMDFWLSRNGHGSGFFDHGNEPIWQKLQDAAKVYGSVDSYLGYDGKVYLQ